MIDLVTQRWDNYQSHRNGLSVRSFELVRASHLKRPDGASGARGHSTDVKRHSFDLGPGEKKRVKEALARAGSLKQACTKYE